MKKFNVVFRLADGSITPTYTVEAHGFKSAYTAAALANNSDPSTSAAKIVGMTCDEVQTVP